MVGASWNNCNNSLSDDQRTEVLLITTICSSFGVLFCLAALTLLFFFKLYAEHLWQRLSLYLLLSGLAHASILVLSVTGIHDTDEHQELCAALGFLLQYTGWVMLLLTTCVTVHNAALVFGGKIIYWLEPFGLLFSLFFPLMFSWIPFLNEGYGRAGGWCWIRIINEHKNCTTNVYGLVEEFVLWYVPFSVLLLANVIVIVAVMVALCKAIFKKYENLDSVQSDPILMEQRRRGKEALKKTLPLMIYPILFQVFNAVALLNRILSASSSSSSVFYPAWVAHAVIVSMWSVCVGVVYIIHLIFKKKYRKKSIKKALKSWKKSLKCCIRSSPSTPYDSENDDRESLFVMTQSTDRFQEDGPLTTSTPTVYVMPHESCDSFKSSISN